MKKKVIKTLKIIGIVILIFIGGVIAMELFVNLFFERSNPKDQLMILCEKDDIKPIIYIYSKSTKNNCFSCPEDLKTRLDNIEINYDNLWKDRENIVNELEVDGWECK